MKLKNLSSLFILCLFIQTGHSQNFYDINTINTIELTFEQSNWDYLLDQLVSQGNEERLVGSAVINGIAYDSVGVRYKGNSSYNSRNIKNPLNIKLDHIIDDQEHEGYGTLKLANGYKDPSFVREVLSYEIAREYMPASQANFAKVTINGTYIGLYTSVQDVDKHFLRTQFGSSSNAFFKGELAGNGMPSEVKIWGYWGTNPSDYYNYYEIESDEGWADLIEFLNTLNSEPLSAHEVLNIDRHLWMLAFDILTVNLDAPVNFAHNYYLYKDDAGRFNPIIWDLNENFGVFANLMNGQMLSTTGMQQLTPYLNASDSNYPIINKILTNPVYKKIYIAHMKTIMEDWFINDRYRTRAQEIQNIIDEEVQNDPNLSYTYAQFISNVDNSIGGSSSGRPGPGSQSITGISQLMENRVAYLNSLDDFQAAAPVISNISTDPANISPGTAVWLTAEVTNAEAVKLAFRNSESEIFNETDMLDDGNHHDGAAGDGIYGVNITAEAGELQYYIYAENNDAAAFLPEQAESSWFTLAVSGNLVINEFMASNDTTQEDQDNEYDDWIELYNNTDVDIALLGYYLSDDAGDLTQWAFPDTVIKAGGYLIVWADKDDDQDGLHADFKLSASGETLFLVNAALDIVSEVAFSAQNTDISQGRYPNGTGSFARMTPSFADENQNLISDIEETDSELHLPDKFTLEQNYPNPFNPSTTIRFSMTEADQASLKIYNATGQLVTTLVDDMLSAGEYTYQWQPVNRACGIYFYTLVLDGKFIETKKMAYIR